jgi:hypothetical protein
MGAIGGFDGDVIGGVEQLGAGRALRTALPIDGAQIFGIDHEHGEMAQARGALC